MAQNRKSGFHISYVTITYRSVLLGVLGVVALAALVMYVAFPNVSNKWTRVSGALLEKALEKMGLGVNPSANSPGSEAGPQQAHFTALDGSVKVKKAATGQTIDAAYTVGLEKNDVIQTGSEGIAKIVFADGTSYSIKPDSLIVVQDNSVDNSQRTNVEVQVTTGTVDLNTPLIRPGSSSKVSFAGAVARIGSETAAQVRNDPRNDESALLLRKGDATVNREGQEERLTDNEKLTFKQDQPGMVKSKEIAPPILVDPPNAQSVFVANENQPVTFSWSEVPNVKLYHIRIAKNPYFSSTVLDTMVQAPQCKIQHLGEGMYYWSVQSITASGKESAESEHNRFQIVFKTGNDQQGLALEIDSYVQFGRVFQILGHTEPGAHVLVNGQSVAVVNADGSFSHFTGKLEPGENVITVTAQNSKGHVNTKTKKVLVQ